MQAVALLMNRAATELVRFLKSWRKEAPRMNGSPGLNRGASHRLFVDINVNLGSAACVVGDTPHFISSSARGSTRQRLGRCRIPSTTDLVDCNGSIGEEVIPSSICRGGLVCTIEVATRIQESSSRDSVECLRNLSRT
jgi:hypothetical protein